MTEEKKQDKINFMHWIISATFRRGRSAAKEGYRRSVESESREKEWKHPPGADVERQIEESHFGVQQRHEEFSVWHLAAVPGDTCFLSLAVYNSTMGISLLSLTVILL